MVSHQDGLLDVSLFAGNTAGTLHQVSNSPPFFEPHSLSPVPKPIEKKIDIKILFFFL